VLLIASWDIYETVSLYYDKNKTMINFFRKIRKKLADENKPLKYLRYAIGEIFLVVIGILIALQINNWNQNRIERKIEKRLLGELIENLEFNEKNLRSDIEEEYKSMDATKEVLKILDNRLAYHESMDYFFGRAQYSPDILLSSTAFHSIQSKGFDIIASDSLRNAIITLFDNDYGFLVAQTVRLENQFWPSSLLPVFHKHFRINDMEGNPFNDKMDAKPVDYDALLNDAEYYNIIKHRGSFRYQGAVIKKDVLDKTLKLKVHIKDYLKKQE